MFLQPFPPGQGKKLEKVVLVTNHTKNVFEEITLQKPEVEIEKKEEN
jgi:uncharacterized pyridoxamine 5'-phosphate oxidase family protein